MSGLRTLSGGLTNGHRTSSQVPLALIALGSSVPSVVDRVQQGFDLLDAHPDLEVTARSDIALTPAAGGATLQPFANAACVVRTAHGPTALLRLLHALEHQAGRLRTRPLGPRCLDLDLIDVVGMPPMSGSGLVLPHPGRTRPYAERVLGQALERHGLGAGPGET